MSREGGRLRASRESSAAASACERECEWMVIATTTHEPRRRRTSGPTNTQPPTPEGLRLHRERRLTPISTHIIINNNNTSTRRRAAVRLGTTVLVCPSRGWPPPPPVNKCVGAAAAAAPSSLPLSLSLARSAPVRSRPLPALAPRHRPAIARHRSPSLVLSRQAARQQHHPNWQRHQQWRSPWGVQVTSSGKNIAS